jgi:membrane protein
MPTLRSLGLEIIGKIGKDKITRQAAAVAYYAMFSLPSFLLLLIAVAGFVLGDDAVERDVFMRIDRFAIGDAATLLKSTVRSVTSPNTNLFISTVSIGLLIFSGTAILRELRTSLDAIFGPEKRPKKGWKTFITKALITPVLFLAAATCFIFTMALTTAIALLHDRAAMYWTGLTLPTLSLLNDGLTLVYITSVVFIFYRTLPSRRPPAFPCAIGALSVTGIAALSRWALALYVSYAQVGAAYGVAASALVLLLSLYYSVFIFLLGAELIDVLVRHGGYSHAKR